MLLAFAVSTLGNYVLLRNFKPYVISGVLSATATAIHSLITPFFVHHIGVSRRRLSLGEETVRSGSALLLTATITFPFKNYFPMHYLFISFCVNVIMAAIFPHLRDVNEASSIVI